MLLNEFDNNFMMTSEDAYSYHQVPRHFFCAAWHSIASAANIISHHYSLIQKGVLLLAAALAANKLALGSSHHF